MKFIYKITNQINSKVYIGQTNLPSRRKAQHLMEGSRETNDKPLYRSMRKHGLENFIFEVIEECSDDLINEREVYWISHYDSTNPKKGYNLYQGGSGKLNQVHRSLSEALKGNKHCVGRIVSDETRDKLRKSWPKVNDRRFGKKIEVIEKRTCHCGKEFEAVVKTNRSGTGSQGRSTCSELCSKVRILSKETRSRISRTLASKESLRDRIRDDVRSRLETGQHATKIAAELNVSYKTICRIHKEIRMN